MVYVISNLKWMKKKMINISRLTEHIIELSKIGKNFDTNGINRFSYTKEEQNANLLVERYMEAAGLNVSYDDIGNLIGSVGPTDKEVIMLGSHIDTVPDGGMFDGSLGVLTAIEVVHTLKENNIDLKYQIKVVSFKDEEGTRFNYGLIGSKAMSGILTVDDLENVDSQNITIKEAIQTQGYSYENLSNNIQNNIKTYIECHIEQGRVLESNDLPIGIVTGIAGPLWIEIEVEGKSEHSGATPMHQRYDALAAASEMIVSIENSVKDSENIVATVGKMNIHPNGVNVIPGRVTFTIDIRSISETDVNNLEVSILDKLKLIAKKREVTISYKILQRVKPAETDRKLQNILANSIKKNNIEPFYLMSGAGHDAMNISRIAPIIMLFVRSKDGISHSPLEYSSQNDINIAANVLYDFLRSIL